MITFSCKKISKEDLIKCAFALNKTEYNLLVFLLKNDKSFTAIQISEMMELDRTTIQKAITQLVNKGLVTRKQKNISGGGYTFFYLITNKQEIKSKIKEVIRRWCKGVEETINEI
ncbi:MarR family transcriptional regulator [Candidatus Woesearchaeota archaeon]|nr:MarR family transcriptional regulator [Candidatus Woesearchaeota archaeon]